MQESSKKALQVEKEENMDDATLGYHLQDELDSLNKLIEMQSEMNRLVSLFSLYQYYSNTDCPLCKHIEMNKTPVTA